MDLNYTLNHYTPTYNDTLEVPHWGYATATSTSSPSPSSSLSPSKRPWPFEGDQDYHAAASTPPNLRPPSEISELINDFVVQLCFGSITDVKAQVTVGNRQPNFSTNGQVHSFNIVEEGAYFSLHHDGINFARLNKGLCGTLKTIVADRILILRAFVQLTELTAIKDAWYHRSRKVFPLEINIYGVESDVNEVGRTLSEANLYLQFPRFGLEGYTYRNPHFLQIEGFSSGVPDASSDSKQQKNREEDNRTPNPDSQTQENVSTAVDNILDSDLTHHVDLGQISVDRRIRQSLRPHQKEAIDFIDQRETGKLSSELSLWKYNDVDQDEPFYQHVFTGAKRPTRMEAKGGIIADEMGLGKTLVILSTIAGTLDRAQKFVAENQPVEGQKQRKIPSQATLVIAPSSLLVDSWVKEIYDQAYPSAITFHRHLGSARHAERHFLQQKMIVFTTYATVAIEHGREKGDSPLSKINWFRIVLDEAHDIRNPATNQFKAVAALTAQHRWCLTGTPIQNTLDDLGALSTFLKVPILESPQTFAKIVKNPINTNAPTRFQNLRVLLKTICLRRTRELLNLPEPVPQIRRIPFTPSERDDYDNLLHQGQVQIDMAVSGRRQGRINSTVLEALLKLRLFCNNGKDFANLHLSANGLPEDPDEALAYLQQLDQNICAYCSGTIYSLSEPEDNEGGSFIGKCPHLVCQNCFPQHRAQKMECPTCASDGKNGIAALERRVSGLHMEGLEQSNNTRRYPSKLLALLLDLQKDLGNKSIVFSCWKKTLNIVAGLLKYYNIRYNMINGSLALNERLKALDDFRSPTGANILLMTLGTGAVGLNLAVATRIYLLEPQWNPSIESQAIGRALRLGQTEQVRIIRYIMAHTVEESNVLDRQKRKLQLAGGGFGKGKDVASVALDIFGVDLPSHGEGRQ